MTELSPTARHQPGLEMRDAYESGAEVLLCFGVSGSKRWQAVAAGMPHTLAFLLGHLSMCNLQPVRLRNKTSDFCSSSDNQHADR